jgi:hypothetical protein
MGIGKKAATHKGKKVVENVTEDIPVVGDLVDQSISSGPMDRTEDGLDRTKDKLDRDKGKLGRDKNDGPFDRK